MDETTDDVIIIAVVGGPIAGSFAYDLDEIALE